MAKQENFYIPHYTGGGDLIPTSRFDGAILNGFIAKDAEYKNLLAQHLQIQETLNFTGHEPNLYSVFLDDVSHLGEQGVRGPLAVLFGNQRTDLKGIDVFGQTEFANVVNPKAYTAKQYLEPMIKMVVGQYRGYFESLVEIDALSVMDDMDDVIDYSMQMGENGMRTNLQTLFLGFR